MADQLDIFGFDTNQLEEVKVDNPTTLSEVFNNIAADMVYCLKQSVTKEGLIYKGKLHDSIRMPVKMFGFNLNLTLFFPIMSLKSLELRSHHKQPLSSSKFQ